MDTNYEDKWLETPYENEDMERVRQVALDKIKQAQQELIDKIQIDLNTLDANVIIKDEFIVRMRVLAQNRIKRRNKLIFVISRRMEG